MTDRHLAVLEVACWLFGRVALIPKQRTFQQQASFKSSLSEAAAQSSPLQLIAR